LLVSKPSTDSEFVDILRKRVAATAARDTQSMTGGPATRPRVITFHVSASNSNRLVWTFADEQGRPWRGVGVVEPDAAMPSEFQVTLSVARGDRGARS
ncbi:MAG: hypothetical protein ACRENK_02025, partial [Gemmatimonadaceae bacterium]